MANRKKKKRELVGRDPALGRVAFKTGTVLTRKDKTSKRKTKLGKKELRDSLDGG